MILKITPVPCATKVIAIVAEKCYQKTCKLTNNQNGMARTVFMLFVCQNLIEICVVSLQLAILIKISRKAAHALLQTKKEEEMLENLGATDIQLIPHFALRLSSKYYANGSASGSRGCASCQYLVACLVFEQKGKNDSSPLT